jgi:hypothetical protein
VFISGGFIVITVFTKTIIEKNRMDGVINEYQYNGKGKKTTIEVTAR